MTYSLVNIDIAKPMQELASIATSPSLSSPPSEEKRVKIIDNVRAQIEGRPKHCNSVIPQQRMTIVCSRFLLRKLDFITRQQWLLLRYPDQPEHFTAEEHLIEALDILEPRLDGEDDLLKQFEWIRKAYPQYHVTTYILWHLYFKPEGPTVDIAWKAMETLFSPEHWDGFKLGSGTKSVVLDGLRAKAHPCPRKGRIAEPGKRDWNQQGWIEPRISRMRDPTRCDAMYCDAGPH